MWRHASDQDLMDVLEGAGPRATLDHVEACEACRARLEGAREGLQLARAADVPEPSPLYWEAFRRQVGRRLGDEPRAPWRWRFRPALAALVVAVALVSLPWARSLRRGGEPPVATLPAWTPLPAAEEDAGLSLIQALAPTADELKSAGGCRGATDCLGELSDEESRALADALRSELRGRDL